MKSFFLTLGTLLCLLWLACVVDISHSASSQTVPGRNGLRTDAVANGSNAWRRTADGWELAHWTADRSNSQAQPWSLAKLHPLYLGILLLLASLVAIIAGSPRSGSK